MIDLSYNSDFLDFALRISLLWSVKKISDVSADRALFMNMFHKDDLKLFSFAVRYLTHV